MAKEQKGGKGKEEKTAKHQPRLLQHLEETVEYIDPDEIELDPVNPRITAVLEAKGIVNPTQEQVAEALIESRHWKTGRTNNAMTFEVFLDSVRRDGILNEPPIVRLISPHHYRVVHGNSRTLVSKKLKMESPGGAFDKIRCRVIAPDTPPEYIEQYMRISHMTKQADWHPSAWAKLLHSKASREMMGAGAMTLDELQAEFGFSRQKISDWVKAYDEMIRYIRKTGDQRPQALWSYFEKMFAVKPVRDRFQGDKEFKDYVLNLLETKKLHDATHVEALPAIYDDPDARKVMENEKSGIAKQFVQEGLESENHFDRLRKLTKIVMTIAVTPSMAKPVKSDPVKKKAVLDLAAAVKLLEDKVGFNAAQQKSANELREAVKLLLANTKLGEEFELSQAA